jgi:hypothetical protein
MFQLNATRPWYGLRMLRGRQDWSGKSMILFSKVKPWFFYCNLVLENSVVFSQFGAESSNFINSDKYNHVLHEAGHSYGNCFPTKLFKRQFCLFFEGDIFSSFTGRENPESRSVNFYQCMVHFQICYSYVFSPHSCYFNITYNMLYTIISYD